MNLNLCFFSVGFFYFCMYLTAKKDDKTPPPIIAHHFWNFCFLVNKIWSSKAFCRSLILASYNSEKSRSFFCSNKISFFSLSWATNTLSHFVSCSSQIDLSVSHSLSAYACFNKNFDWLILKQIVVSPLSFNTTFCE